MTQLTQENLEVDIEIKPLYSELEPNQKLKLLEYRVVNFQKLLSFFASSLAMEEMKRRKITKRDRDTTFEFEKCFKQALSDLRSEFHEPPNFKYLEDCLAGVIDLAEDMLREESEEKRKKK